MEETKEASVVEEKTLVKPEFNSEIKVEIKSIGDIEDNIQEVKQYAIDLANYYENITFTEDTLKEATSEKAEVNKFKDKVATLRKEIEKKWNEPLETFNKEAKETEEILKNTYESINSQVLHYQNLRKEEKKEKNKAYFEEYAKSKNIDFLTYEQAKINITLNSSDKKLNEEAKKFVDEIEDGIKLINSQEYADEMIIEFKKDLNVARAITEVQQRHIALEQAKKEKEEKKEQELTDQAMLEKIDKLTAPKEVVKEEILELTFKVRGTREKLKQLKKFLEDGGYDYE